MRPFYSVPLRFALRVGTRIVKCGSAAETYKLLKRVRKRGLEGKFIVY